MTLLEFSLLDFSLPQFPFLHKSEEHIDFYLNPKPKQLRPKQDLSFVCLYPGWQTSETVCENLSFLVTYLSLRPHPQWTTEQKHKLPHKIKKLHHGLSPIGPKLRPYSVEKPMSLLKQQAKTSIKIIQILNWSSSHFTKCH